MRWLQTEYILKGIFLGLVFCAALQQADAGPDAWLYLTRVNLLALGGLALALVLAAVAKLRAGYGARQGLLLFLFFLLLESPTLIYAGILGGTLAGVLWVRQSQLDDLLAPILAGGAALGLAFGVLRQVQDRTLRLGLILALAGGLVAALLFWFGKLGDAGPQHGLKDPTVFAVQLLLGIPFFYLLTFAGHEEESEVEIGAMCAALGVGLGILTSEAVQVRSLAFVIPVLLYFGYTLKVLPGLRVLKHAFRGFSYTRAGRHRQALHAFRRALQLDPNNKLARDGFWDVHRLLDLDQLATDRQTQALVDLDLCLQRAGWLLQSRPTPEQMNEALRLLDLVLSLAPALEPSADYWRAVAYAHAQRLDEAAASLEHLLDPAHYGADNPYRRAMLLSAWQLALTLHPGLRQRIGQPQLSEPGRRMEAIAAVEQHLADNPQDQAIWGLKRVLYQDVTEAEYEAWAGPGLAAPHFDHAYVQQLGLALIDDNARWQRGGEYLRLAARGLPALGPTLFVQVAQAYQRAGHADEARHNYELARRAGCSVGPKNLAEAERQAYFSTVKLLGEDAIARGDLDAAIENFQLYTESERSGLETLRTLADLYERKGDALSALRVNDQALVYNAKDKDLLERKDRYYYSVMPEQLQARLEQARAGFDVEYCLRKARSILDARQTDAEWLDVAHHLLQLAVIVRPDSVEAKVLLARALLRYGESEKALTILEDVHEARPEKFSSGADEDAWYTTCQVLSDLYLERGRADLAIPCLIEFRKSTKSGARTLFKLGQAHEMLGDRAHALRFYKQVTAYEGNPLTSEAYQAMQRLEQQA